jgi:hypothetical protein
MKEIRFNSLPIGAERPATALGRQAQTPSLFGGSVVHDAKRDDTCQARGVGHRDPCDGVDARCGPPPDVITVSHDEHDAATGGPSSLVFLRIK